MRRLGALLGWFGLLPRLSLAVGALLALAALLDLALRQDDPPSAGAVLAWLAGLAVALVMLARVRQSVLARLRQGRMPRGPR